MEAAEALAVSGFKPQRTVLFMFGHDEEVSGSGAEAGVALLKSRGIEPEMALDEGFMVLNPSPLTGKPTGFIGIAEKGFLTLDLTAREPGGHSSTPPRRSAIGRIARAVQRLEDNPLPARIDGVAAQTLDALAPQFPIERRLVIQNRALFGPLLEWFLARDPATNAMIRTTTAVTLVRGGVKENVLPQSATATVNLRLLPGDDVAGVIARVREILGDDAIEITKRTALQDSGSPRWSHRPTRRPPWRPRTVLHSPR